MCAGRLAPIRAIITEPLDRAYDRIVLDAAKTWRYQPATRNGMAVNTGSAFS